MGELSTAMVGAAKMKLTAIGDGHQKTPIKGQL